MTDIGGFCPPPFAEVPLDRDEDDAGWGEPQQESTEVWWVDDDEDI